MPCNRTPVPNFLCFFTCVLVCCALSGCSNRPKPYPASGQVIYEDGQPLQGGRIEVRSLEHPVVARGSIDNEGKFSLTTYEADDGAVAGKHEVLIVQKFTADVDDMAEHAKHATVIRTLDSKFSRYKTSGLSMNVERGGTSDLVPKVAGAAARR